MCPEDIKVILTEICEKYAWIIRAIEIMPDHVHLFITTPPFDAPSKIAKIIKGSSAWKIFQLYPDLRKELWGCHLWSPSYYCGIAGMVSAEIIKKYIEAQTTKK